jgi:NADH-quinone oxidoreductase subunit J
MSDLFVPLLIGCVVALASALGVVLARRPVYAAIFLLVHSLSLAALFGLMSAAMVAIGQVVIYSGAIVVLFLFVVTLLPSGGAERTAQGGRIAGACVACGAVVIALAAALSSGILPAAPTSPGDLGPSAVGNTLFSTLLVAFELTAPLLLVAIVGAVVIWRRHEPRPRTTTPVKIGEPRSLVMHQ